MTNLISTLITCLPAILIVGYLHYPKLLHKQATNNVALSAAKHNLSEKVLLAALIKAGKIKDMSPKDREMILEVLKKRVLQHRDHLLQQQIAKRLNHTNIMDLSKSNSTMMQPIQLAPPTQNTTVKNATQSTTLSSKLLTDEMMQKKNSKHDKVKNKVQNKNKKNKPKKKQKD